MASRRRPGQLSSAQAAAAAVSSKRATAAAAAAAAEAAEVRQLCDGAAACTSTSSSSTITALLCSQAARQEAAWQRYENAEAAAQQQHAQRAAAAAAALKQQLDAGAAALDAALARLTDESQLMLLDERELQAVLERVQQQRGVAAAGIDGLGAQLAASEAALRSDVEAALAALAAGAHEAAHLDAGQQQRLLEQAALRFNLAVLDDRRDTAAALQRLHEQQLAQEAARRQRWEEARGAWRGAHSRHAAARFCAHVSGDLAEPAARLQLFAVLRDSQAAAHAQLATLCQRAAELQPPRLTAALVDAWCADAAAAMAAWQQVLGEQLAQLAAQEDALEQQVQDGMAVLQAELGRFADAAEAAQLMAQQACPAIERRRAVAGELLARARAFLERQAAEWQLALVGVLGSWLRSVSSLHEQHKAAVTACEAGAKASLRAARAEFEAADAAREAALAHAVTAVSRGSSESELDARVAAAMACLAEVEHGYRAFASSSGALARALPVALQQQCQLYRQCLCGLLHVEPASREQCGKQPAAAAAAGVAQQQAAAAAAPRPASPAAPPPQPLHVPGAAAGYRPQHDLWQALLDATPKPWQPEQQQPEPAAAPPPAAAPEAAKAPAVPATAPGKGMTKQQAEAAAAAAATQAEAAAAAAAVAAAAATAAATPPPCPLAANGLPLCQQLAVPAATVCESLQSLQQGLLSDMATAAARDEAASQAWAREVELLLKEELDARLRAHRVRPGRLEEEVRATRSTELLAQARRVQAHVRAAGRGLAEQQAAFTDAAKRLRADASAWSTKLLGAERLLGAALSSKSIDACWREALALRAKLDRQLAEQLARVTVQVHERCNKLVAANQRFEAEQLKSFEDGGAFAPESVAAHEATLAGVDASIASQRQQQLAQLDALQAELSGALAAAQASVEAMLPSFKQDMALIEALNRCVDGARKRAASELARNRESAAAIDDTLAQLQQQLAAAATAPQAAAAALPACQQLLSAADKLRLQLLQQAQVLEVLQSKGLTASVIDVTLGGDAVPAGGDSSSSSSAGGSSSSPAASASRPAADKAGSRPGTGQKPAGPGSSGSSKPGRPGSPKSKAAAAAAASAAAAAPPAAAGGGGSSASGAPVVSLARDIQLVIDAAKQEAEAAGKAYYAAKDAVRPVRYPARIAGSCQELVGSVSGTLAELTQQLQQHVAVTTTQLRAQVGQACELLQRVPGSATGLFSCHLLGGFAQQQRRLLAEFGARRQQLEQQLEANRRALQPSMLAPGRRAELVQLQQVEAGRQAAAGQLASELAAASCSLATSSAAQLPASLGKLCQLLVALLDGCVLPADLLPAAGDGAAPGARQQQQQQEPQAVAALLEPAPARPKSPAAPTKASSKQSSPGKAAAAAAAAAAAEAASALPAPSQAPRPFETATWPLAVRALSLGALGWLPEDQAALQASGPSSAGSGTGSPAAAAAASPAPVPAPRPPGAAGAKAGAQQQAAPAKDAAPASVSGCDTALQRAALDAHAAALGAVEAALGGGLGRCRRLLQGMLASEAGWAGAWAGMLAELETGA